jgi:hypothetical protein
MLGRIVVLVAALAVGCNKGKSDPATAPADEQPEGPGTLAVNPYVAAYPQNVALASPLAPSGAGAGLPTADQINAGTISVALDDGTPASDYAAKVAALQAVLKATTLDGCVAAIPKTFTLARRVAPCFAPEVTYTGHPDAHGAADGSDAGTLAAGTLGVWYPYADPHATAGEACAADEINAQTESVAAFVDTALGVHALLVCVAGLTQNSLADVGGTVDLGPHVKDLATGPVKISSAVLVRTEDVDGQIAFASAVEGTLTDATGATHGITLNVRNRDKNGVESSGIIGVRVGAVATEGDVTFDRVATMKYARTASSLDFRVLMNDSNAALPQLVDDVGEAIRAPADGDACEASLGWCRSYHEIVANLDGAGYGRTAYASLATRTARAASVFDVLTKPDHTGSVAFGHAAAGAPNQGDVLTIKALRCFPTAGPLAATADVYGTKVQHQDVKHDGPSGLWVATASKIAYAPTASCDWDAANDDGHAAIFTVTGSDGVGTELAYPRANDLYDAATFLSSWTAVTAP